MSDDTFRNGKEPLHYAMARYVCQWLDGHGQLWPFYRAWRDSNGADPTGASAFARVTGKTPAMANAEWVTWVKGL